jgi:alkylation response protein AidB-like acyl-CoA dehydrogenase
MPYNAPVSQIADTLARIGRLDELAATGAFPNFDAELVAPILDEANKLARDVLAPLNPVGHKTGAKLTDAGVVPTPGFADAYRQFVEGGWMSLAFPEAFGGQGLPKPLALAVFEMIHGANMAFGLCPLLSFGAIEAILAHGTDEQKQTYLPKLISGEWTGAMNLTEPQAGSDVGALTTKAVPNGDGSYAITGQKIFITWGDHDMTPNIIQLVLARLPDAPPGSKGISLFVAPKFFVNADGTLGERNTFRCIGLEHKMGIHGSPTCVMEYTNAKGVAGRRGEQGPRRHVHDDELRAPQCRPRRRRRGRGRAAGRRRLCPRAQAGRRPGREGVRSDHPPSRRTAHAAHHGG